MRRLLSLNPLVRTIAGLTAIVILATCSANQVGLGDRVDITPPKVKIASPETGFYAKGDLVLKGNASDDIGIKDLSVSYSLAAGGSANVKVPVTGGAWTYTIPSGLAAGGKPRPGAISETPNKQVITVTSTDASGKSSSDTVMVYVDNLAPTVLVTAPLGHGTKQSQGFNYRPVASANLDVKGEVYDSSPVQSVQVTLLKADGTSLEPATVVNKVYTKVADGTNTFSVRFPLNDKLNPSKDFLTDGAIYIYQIKATDAAGNTNTYYYHSLDIYPLLAAGISFPTIGEIAGLDNSEQPVSEPSKIKRSEMIKVQLGNLEANTEWGDIKYEKTARPTIQFSNLEATTETVAANTLGSGSVVSGNIIPPANTGSIDLKSVRIDLFQQAAPPAEGTSSPADNLVKTWTSNDFTADAPGKQDADKLVPISDSFAFTVSLPAKSFGPGPYYVRVTAKSMNSELAAVLVRFFIDDAYPTLDENQLDKTPGAITPYVKGSFQLGGTAASGTGIAKVTLSDDGGKTFRDCVLSNVTATSAGWTTGDLSAGKKDGIYSYQLNAVGTSGKKTPTLYRTVILDTTAPTLALTYPQDKALVGEKNVEIRGTAFDTGIGLAGVEYSLDGGKNWNNAVLSGSDWSAPVSFSGEGTKTLQVRALDKLGNATGTTSATFSYDLAVPTLTVSSPASADTLYSRGNVVFRGTASDSNGLKNVVLTHQKDTDTAETVDATLETSPSDWETTFQPKTDGTSDGVYTFRIRATDTAGRPSVAATRTVVIDCTAPQVLLDQTGPVPTTDTLLLSGTAKDNLGLDSVQYQVGATLPAGWKPVNGTSVWNQTIDFSAFPEGNLTVYFRARDRAQNESSLGSVVVNIDHKNPVADFSQNGGLTVIGALPGTKANFTLAGQAHDNGYNPSLTPLRQAASADLTYSKDGGPTTAAALPGFDPSTGAWTWAKSVDLTDHKDDGLYLFTLTVTDTAGKTTKAAQTLRVDTTAPLVTVSKPVVKELTDSALFTAAGTAMDSGVGLKAVRVSLDNASWTTAVLTGNTWTAPLDLGTKEGAETLTVEAIDQLGNTSSTQVAFFYDKAPPKVSERGIAALGHETDASASGGKSADFTMTLGAEDSNSLKSLAVTAKVTVGQTVTDKGTVFSQTAAGTGPSSWTFPVTVNKTTHADDGVWVYTITATDIADRTTVLTRTVIVDTTAPALTCDVSNQLADTKVRFTGTALDANLDKIEYRLGAGAWTPVDTTAENWTTVLDFTGVDEGSYTIQLRASDKSSNTSPTVTVVVNVDHRVPVADFGKTTGLTPLSDGSKAVSGAFTLAGAAHDNAFAPTQTPLRQAKNAVLTYSKDGGPSVSSTGLTFDAGAGTWSWSKTPAADHSDDGLYVFTLTVTDNYDKTTSVSQTLRIDTSAPNLSVATPTPNDLNTTGSYKIQGSALDLGTGLNADAVSYILTTNGTAEPAATADLSGSTWSKTLTLTAEGTYTLKVTAKDKLGNAVSSPEITFYYDKAVPTIGENEVGTTNKVYRNGSFTLGGSGIGNQAADSNGLAKVTIAYSKDSVDQPSVELPVSGKASGWSRTFTADGTYVFSLTATDIAGRTSIPVFRTVVIDTAAPSLDSVTPFAAKYYADTQLSVSGKASDALSGIKSVEFLLKDSAPVAGDPWLPLAGTTDWFKNDISASGLTEGTHQVWFRVTDNALNTAVSASGTAFIVDHDTPVLTFDAATLALTFTNGGFDISGTVADANLAASPISVSVTKDGTNFALSNPLSYTSATGAFSQHVATSVSGSYVITVTAKDKFDRATVEKRTVTVDSTPPSVQIVNFDRFASGSKVNGTVAFKALSSDANGIEGTKYFVTDGNFSAAAPGYGATTATAGVQLVFADGAANTTQSLDTSALTDGGSYFLWAVAKDKAGNTAASTATPFTVDQATDKPVVTLTAIDVSVTAKANAKTNRRGLSDGTALSGTISDDDGLPASAILRIDLDGNGSFADSGETKTLALTPVGGSNLTKSFSFDLSGLPEGAFAFEVDVQDTAKNVHNQAMTPVWFAYDTSAPSGSITAKNADASALGPFTRQNVDLAGTFADANGVDSVELSTDGKDTWAPLTIVQGVSGTWSSSLTAAGGNGAKAFAVRITDSFGRSSTYDGPSVTVDTAPPSLGSITPFAAKYYADTQLSVSGKASDALSGVKSVEFLLKDTAPAAGDSWTGLTGTTDWFKNDISASGLSEGSHKVWFRVTDNALNSTISSSATEFIVDHANPVIGYDAATLALTFTGGAFHIKGAVSDTNLGTGTFSATVSRDGTDLVLGTGFSFSYDLLIGFDVSVTDSTSGSYVITVTAKDKFDRATVEKRTVTVDSTPPSVQIVNFDRYASGSKVNGTVAFKALSSDANGIEGTKYFVTDGTFSAAAPGYTATAATAGVKLVFADGAANTTQSLDTSALTDGGSYFLWAVAKDKAGNTASGSATPFTVDQATDKPVVTLTAIDVSVTAKANAKTNRRGLSDGTALSGTISDDDGLPASATLRIDLNGNGSFADTGETKTLALTPVGGSNLTKSFSFDLSGLGSEGAFAFQVDVQDTVLAVHNQTMTPVWFAYDTSAPTGSITAKNADNSALGPYTNQDIALTGTFADANGVASVELSTDGKATWAPLSIVPGVSGSWSSALTAAGNNGAKAFAVRITDSFGRSSTYDGASTVVDTVQPVLAVDDPGIYLSGTTGSLTGTADDGTGSGLAQVQFSLVSAAGPWTDATGKNNWLAKVNLDPAKPNANPNLAPQSEGPHKLYVLVTDKAGNTVSASRDFTVDQAPPALTLFKENGTDFTAGTIYENADVGLSGTAVDTNGVKAVTATLSKAGGTSGALTISGSGTTSWPWTATAALSQGDGTYTLTVTITDLADRTTSVTRTIIKDSQLPDAPAVTDPAASGKWLSGASYSFAGTAKDNGGAGIAKVYYGWGSRGITPPASLADPFWNLATGGAVWSAPVSLTGEGPRSLYLRAVDNAENASAVSSFDYGIDQGAPEAAFDPATTALTYVNGTFVLSGTDSDTNEIDTVTAQEKGPADLTFSPSAGTMDTSAAGKWTFTRIMNKLDGKPDGIYQFKITVRDKAGKTVTLDKSVTRDTLAPGIVLDDPLPTIKLASVFQGNGTMTLKGSASDLNGLQNLEIQVGADAWAPLGTAPFTSFAYSLDTAARPDKADLTVSFRATDKAGNPTVEPLTIHVDQATDKPQVAITSPAASEKVLTAAFTMVGTITDDDGVDPATVQYRLSRNGGITWDAWTAVPAANVTGSAASKSFSYNLNDPSNGPKLLQIQAKDTSGLASNVGVVSFSQDTGAPVLTGISPAEGLVTNAGSVTVSGTATDDSAVTSVTYRVLRDGVEVVAATAAVLGADTGSGKVVRSFTTPAIDVSASPNNGSGAYQIQLVSSDGTNTRQEVLNVTVDRTAPVPVFGSPAEGSTQNNTVTLSGTASDNRNLASVRLQIWKDGTLVKDLGTAVPAANWSLGFDTVTYGSAAYATAGTGSTWNLTLKVLAADDAGNIGETVRNLVIDQTTDTPKVTLTNVTKLDGSDILLTPALTGTATDDDGIAKIEVSLDGGAWTEVSPPGGGWGTSANWTSNFTGTDGVKNFQVKVTDTSAVQNSFTVVTTTSRSFQLNQNPPTLTISSPAANSKVGGSSDLSVIAAASDVTGIKSVRVRLDDPDFSKADGGTWDATLSGGSYVALIPNAKLVTVEGTRTVYVQAKDLSDDPSRTTVQTRTVTVDKTPPMITVTSHDSLTNVNGALKLAGLAEDDSGISSVKILVGTPKQVFNASGKTSWSYQFTAADINTTFAKAAYGTEVSPGIFHVPFEIDALDNAGNLAKKTDFLLEIDPSSDRPKVSILSHSNATVAQTVSASTTTSVTVSSLDSAVKVGQVLIFSDNSSRIITSITGKTLGWTSALASAPSGTVTVITSEETVGGLVRIYGSASDDDGLERVQISFDANDDGNYGDAWPGAASHPTDTAFPGDPIGYNWYPVTSFAPGYGKTGNWSILVNQDGEFNALSGSTNPIRFRVRAIDKKSDATPSVASADDTPSKIRIVINNQIPLFEGLSLNSGDTIGGAATLTGFVKDPSVLTNLFFNYEGPKVATNAVTLGSAQAVPVPVLGNTVLSISGSTKTSITVASLPGGIETGHVLDFGGGIVRTITSLNAPAKTLGWVGALASAPSGAVTARSEYSIKGVKYRLSIPIDTTVADLYPSSKSDPTGPLSLSLKAADDSNFIGVTYVSLSVDNKAPSDLNYTSGSELMGTSMALNGTVKDVGAVNGINRVVLFFARGGLVYKVKNAVDPKAGTALDQAKLLDLADPTYADYRIVIDKTSEQGNDGGANGDADGFNEWLSYSAGVYTWSVQADTTQIRDGLIDLHYVAFDSAGNQTAGETDGASITNNRPTITSVTFGTDLDGDGQASTAGEAKTLTIFNTNSDWVNKTVQAVDTANQRWLTSASLKNQSIKQGFIVDFGAGVTRTILTYDEASGTVKWLEPLATLGSYLSGTVSVRSPVTPVATFLTVKNSYLKVDVIAPRGNGTKTLTLAYKKPDNSLVTLKTGALTGDTASVTLTAADTALWASVPESKLNTASFMVSVSDSTDGGSLSNAREILSGVDNADAAKPAVVLTPFYWNSATSNSLYGNSRTNGHIDLVSPYTAANAAVSGKIKVEGTAFDDQSIASLWVKIDSMTLAGSLGTGTGALAGYAKAASFNGSWTLPPATLGTDGWQFTASTSSLGFSGHTAAWTLDWDTSKLTGVTGLNKAVQVAVMDKTGNVSLLTPAPGTVVNATAMTVGSTYKIVSTGNTDFTLLGASDSNVGTVFTAADVAAGTTGTVVQVGSPATSVDVVPYIALLQTSLSSVYASIPSVFTRSAAGAYPVAENEVFTVYGFNFDTSSTTATGVTLGGTALTVSAAGQGTGGNASYKYLTVSAGSTAGSGALAAKVSTIGTTNNTNANSNTYNQEPNNRNNNTLTDDRYLSVWAFSTLVNNNQIYSPDMKITAAGDIYLSYGLGTDAFYMAKNPNGTWNGGGTSFETCYSRYDSTAVGVDTAGNLYGFAMDTDRISSDLGGATKFTFFSRTPSTSSTWNYSTGTNKRQLEVNYNGTAGIYDNMRTQRPTVAVAGAGSASDPSRLYLTYYDNITKEVKFRYGEVTGDNTIAYGLASNVTNVNPGSAAGYQSVATAGSGTFRSGPYMSAGVVTTVAAAATTVKTGGTYTIVTADATPRFDTVGAPNNAVGTTFVATGNLASGTGTVSQQIAVMAWYDATNNQLVFSYNDTPSDSGGASVAKWQTNARAIDTDYAGWFVSLAVDENMAIHLAYYSNASGDLRYAYIPNYQSAAAAQVVTVDSYLSVGQQVMVTTRKVGTDIIPYISYLNVSSIETRNSLKTAWRKDLTTLRDGAGSDELFTGGWEVMTVPTSEIPKQAKVCNGTVTGKLTLGYVTNTMYQQARLK